VRFLLPRVPCAVVDVGAGTGKLTAVLVGLGCEVVAVEPDPEMRARIAGAEVRTGTAEELPLAARSVDAIVAGQAAHWFDRPRFLDEAARVLRPGGTVGLLWNEVDDRVDAGAELARVAHTIGGVYTAVERTPPFEDDRLDSGELAEVPHVQSLDAVSLGALVSSFSSTILLPADQRAALLAEVERWARGRFGSGPVELPYVARAWRYALRA